MSVEDLLLKRDLMACTWWPIVRRSCWWSWSGWLPLLVTRVVILGVFLEGKEFWATVFHKAEMFWSNIFSYFCWRFHGFSLKTFGWQVRFRSDLPTDLLTRSRQCPHHQNIISVTCCNGQNILFAKYCVVFDQTTWNYHQVIFSVFDNTAINPLFTFKLIVYFYGVCWTNVWQPNGF